MTIKELQKEKIISAKADKIRSTALGIVLDGAKKIAKDENRDATEADIVIAAKRNIKALSKTIDEIGSGELVDKYKAEISVYKEFLPAMVNEATLQTKINEIIASIPEGQRSMKAMGRIIGPIKQEFGDSADMAIVSRLAKAALV